MSVTDMALIELARRKAEAENATLRERLAGEVGALKNDIGDSLRKVGATWSGQQADVHVGVNSPHLFLLAETCANAAIDRAVAVIRGEA